MSVILEMKNCAKHFKGLHAVKDFSATLESGKIYGLIGTNGAGKTTVINMLSGNLRPTSGSIVFDGRVITAQRPDRIAAVGISRTFQNLRLFNEMTVLENVIVGGLVKKSYNVLDGILGTKRYSEVEKAQRETAMQMLDFMNISDCSESLAGSLSYGLQRRLEIARALASKPRLLLLDEPAAGMNPRESMELVQMIRRIRDEFDLTILLIEHDMKVVMSLCEYTYVMAAGEIIAADVPEKIRKNQDVIRAYLGGGV